MKRETLREYCERVIAEADDWEEAFHGAVGLHLSDDLTGHPGRPGGNQTRYVKVKKIFVNRDGRRLRAMADMEGIVVAVESAGDQK